MSDTKPAQRRHAPRGVEMVKAQISGQRVILSFDLPDQEDANILVAKLGHGLGHGKLTVKVWRDDDGDKVQVER